MVARLEDAARPVRPARPAKVVPFPAAREVQRRRRAAPARLVAAAPILVLGGGLLFQLAQPGAPPLPRARGRRRRARRRGGGGLSRGRRRRRSPRSCAGRRGRGPPPTGCGSRRWTTRCSGRRRCPRRRPACRPKWQEAPPAVVYVWTVEALDASGARLAPSEPVRFRARPAREAPGRRGCNPPVRTGGSDSIDWRCPMTRNPLSRRSRWPRVLPSRRRPGGLSPVAAAGTTTAAVAEMVAAMAAGGRQVARTCGSTRPSARRAASWPWCCAPTRPGRSARARSPSASSAGRGRPRPRAHPGRRSPSPSAR